MTKSLRRRYWQLSLLGALAVVEAVGTVCDRALAQIAPDNTLGTESSKVTSSNPGAFQIDGGATRGTNLFHSFSEFSVPTKGVAFFNNGLSIQNIISRVTGGSVSNIDGLLRANGKANLFLINPNGIIFSSNASLKIGGSFLASTASSLKFADGSQFSATAPQATPLLTISVPIGLQFGEPAAAISVNGSGLAVQPDKSLALVGGDLAAFGGANLAASGGRIELGSVAGNSLVNLTSTDQGWALSYGGIQNFQDISLSQGAAIVSLQGGGDVQVQGRRVRLTDGAYIATTPTQAEVQTGDVTVRASDSVELVGTTPDGLLGSGLFSQVARGATGNGGTVTIETGQLLIRDGAAADTSTFGAGRAGNLIVRASDSVTLIGTGTQSTPDVQLPPSGLFAQVAQGGTGNAGDVTVETGRLTILGGAQASTAARTGGQGGTLTINALDSIQLSGTSPTATMLGGSSGLFVSAEPGTGATSNAGKLTVTTGNLTV